MACNRRLVLAVLLHATLASISHYMLTVLNSLEPFVKNLTFCSIESHYGQSLDDHQWSWAWSLINSALPLGALLGSPLLNLIVCKYGRRNAVMVIKNLGFIVSALLQFSAQPMMAIELLVLGRFLWGLVYNLSLFTPTFLTECAPVRQRGTASTAVQVGFRVWVAIGVVAALPQVLGSDHLWHFALLVPVLPALLHMCCTSLIPKSPKALYARRHDVKATMAAIQWYHGDDADVDAVLNEYATETSLAEEREQAHLLNILQTKHLRWPFVLSLMVWASLPLGGVMIAHTYSTSVIETIGMDQESAALFTAVAVQVPSVLLSCICTIFVDRVGRKLLLLVGLAMMIVALVLLFSTGILGESTLSNVFSVAGMALILNGEAFALLCLILPGELCPVAIRSYTTSFSMTACWVLFLLGVFAFPPMFDIFGSNALLPLLILSVLIWVWLWHYLPETKGKTVEEVLHKWMPRQENGEVCSPLVTT